MNNPPIEQLFRQVQLLGGNERDQFLAALADDVRAELRSRLAAADDEKGPVNPNLAAEDCSSDSGLEATVDAGGESRQARPVNTQAQADSSPAKIGPFKILQPIGKGGMGQVYMADQTEPVKRRVALKVIKTDTPTKEILARFEAERQALAMMDHHNIAKVLDAGITEDGRPYFAMELVKGVPITEYCDQNKLTLDQRLNLFVQTCRAIQHAHQKGILHRDIKPSNVLVTLYDGKPVAKVIDFGLAKALQETAQLTNRTLFTHYGQVVGTLAYMSPEQAEMNTLDVDTRTDVYSLGVILYELLTGSTPIGQERIRTVAFDRVLALIREEEVPRPSTRLSESGDAIIGISVQRKTEPKQLSLILKGDLDWIAVKALEKDRTRRYDGPGSLADDVQRYLDDEAVEAHPPSFGYRLRTAIRKHRATFVVAAGVFILLVAGLAGTGAMWWRASVAEKAAIEMATKKETTAKFALDLMEPLNKLRQLILTIVIAPNRELRLQLDERQRQLTIDLDRTFDDWNSPLSPEEDRAFVALRESWKDYKQIKDFTVTKALTGYRQEAFINALQADERVYGRLTDNLARLWQAALADSQASGGAAATSSKAIQPLRTRTDDSADRTAVGGLVKGSHIKLFIPSLPHVYTSHAINAGLIRPSDNARGWEYNLATAHRQIDATTYEFQLRRGVRFQDGSPFNADAVVMNMEAFKQEPVLYSKIDQVFDRCEKISDYDVRFHLKEKYGCFMNDLMWLHFYTREYLDIDGWNGKVSCPNLSRPGPFGLGPYILAEGYLEGDRQTPQAVLKANPYYWDRVYPKVETITIFTELDSTFAMDCVLRNEGKLDITILPPEYMVNTVLSPYAKLVTSSSTNNIAIHFNLINGNPKLRDRKVRRALNEALDQRSLAEFVFEREAVLSPTQASPFYPGMQKVNQSIRPYSEVEDPTQPTKRLELTNILQGLRLRVLTQNRFLDLWRGIETQLSFVGVTLEIEEVKSEKEVWGPLLKTNAGQNENDWDLLVWGNDDWFFNHPFSAFSVYRTHNVWSTIYPDPILDGYIEEMFRASVDDPEFQEITFKIVKHVYDEAYMLFVPTPNSVFAVNKEVVFRPYRMACFPLWKIQVSDQHWSVRMGPLPEERKQAVAITRINY